MLEVTVNSDSILLKAKAPNREESARTIMNEIKSGDRFYQGNGAWKVNNPYDYAHIPAIFNALEDYKKQSSFFETAN